MRPASAAFLEQVATSHLVVVRAEVLGTDLVIDSVTDGTVNLDQTAATRGRLDLTITDDGTGGLIPQTATDPLAPYGNELKVSRGVRLSDRDELIALGVFRIDETNVEDTGAAVTITVTGNDRSVRVIDARFEEPYVVPAGTNYTEAIRDVIDAGVPGLTYNFAESTQVTPQLVANEGDDRWAFAKSMATAIGMDLYFDGDGVCVLAPVAQATEAPVAAIAEGRGGVLLRAGRQWVRTSAFNAVIATGENTGEVAPARGVARDLNPQSPTYYYGDFGKVPRFFSSPFIATDDQATSAAAAILARELGTTQTVNFGAIVNPALEPDDVITITRARAGIDEAHVIDKLTIPLTADQPMAGGTRAVTAIF